jgi:hydroxyacylglutathione hydrolase
MEERNFGPVRIIPGENQGKYPFCHSLYIEGAGVLIDPASNRERLAHLKKTYDIEAIWLSHWHEDHFMHLDLFNSLPLWVSKQDAPPLSDLEVFLDWYGLDDHSERQYWRCVLTEQFHFQPRKPSGFLENGDRIKLGPVTVEVIHTPGHTPGHLAFLIEEPEVLFMGDYDLTKFGPWYGDSFSSIKDTIASIEHLRQIPAKVRLTSHETGIYEKEPGELWDQYLGVIKEREEKLLKLLEKPRTMEEIVEAWIVYGQPREPRAFFAFGERAIMRKHLEHLIGESIVIQEGVRFFRVQT